jgi:hypothetical protein
MSSRTRLCKSSPIVCVDDSVVRVHGHRSRAAAESGSSFGHLLITAVHGPADAEAVACVQDDNDTATSRTSSVDEALTALIVSKLSMV